MRAALAAGAAMINDINALRAPGALDAVQRAGCGLCLMHMQGEPRTMQQHPHYDDVVAEVKRVPARAHRGLRSRRHRARAPRDRSRVRLRQDAGSIISRCCAICDALRALGVPVLAGLSRKSMLGAITGRGSERPPGGQRRGGPAGGAARRGDRARARCGRDARCVDSAGR